MVSLMFRALKAKQGDALMLSSGETTVLIDGGPSGVFAPTLRDHLASINERDGRRTVDLLIVSHIDEDHVVGLLDLTRSLIDQVEQSKEPLVRIGEAWHNSFSDLIAGVVLEPRVSIAPKAQPAKVANMFDTLFPAGLDGHTGKMVLASVDQGRDLRLNLERLHVDMNSSFEGGLVLQGAHKRQWRHGDLSLTVIGPTKAQLDDLRDKWREELPSILAKEARAKPAAVELDTSITNLSSICVIAEVANKRVLLTGDARGDNIIDWLRDTGNLDASGNAHFDILKLPHHGSHHNVPAGFFERITAAHYVISGNGRYGNPEPETLAMLFAARPNMDYQIHLTYGLEHIKKKKEFGQKRAKALDSLLADEGRRKIINFPSDEEAGFIEIRL